MLEPLDLTSLVERVIKDNPAASTNRTVIEKELLHYDILYVLGKTGLLDNLTFQGGTCLRLCYGANRYSEDLDFVVGAPITQELCDEVYDTLQRNIETRYGLPVRVTGIAPKARDDGIEVSKWQVTVDTRPEQSDVPSQRIKIELCSVPAHTRSLQRVQSNYRGLPQGYTQQLIKCESLPEIYADKVKALITNRRFVRYRDIWDLGWLHEQGVKLDGELLRAKIADYQVQDYPALLEKAQEWLPDAIHSKAFADEMTRFLPVAVLDASFYQQGFLDYLQGHFERVVLREAKIAISTGAGFRMS